MSIGILGGGLAGLTVAAFAESGCEVLEKSERAGGHCRSILEQGFTFDAGGPHIIFSRDAALVELMLSLLGENVRQGRRNNKIRYGSRYVHYPFENGLADLAPEDRFDCLYQYLFNPYQNAANFKEWLYCNFGKGIADRYLIPYNEKIWKTRCEDMGLDWVDGRIPKPPAEDVIKSAVGVRTEGYTHQLHYYYPLTGGIESLPRALETRALHRAQTVLKGFDVKNVRRERDGWCVSDGTRERRYRRLISTMPIQDLVDAVEGVPADIASAVHGLRYNSLVTVTLGVEGVEWPEFTAIYVPAPAASFHRLSFPAVFSAANAPVGKSVIQAEITVPGAEFDGCNDEQLTAGVIAGLEDMGLLKRSQICYSKAVMTRYGYPVMGVYDKEELARAKRYFADLGIVLCGRVAEFEYINMDVCIGRGLRVAAALGSERTPARQ